MVAKVARRRGELAEQATLKRDLEMMRKESRMERVLYELELLKGRTADFAGQNLHNQGRQPGY